MGKSNFWSISVLGQMVKLFSHLSNVYVRSMQYRDKWESRLTICPGCVQSLDRWENHIRLKTLFSTSDKGVFVYISNCLVSTTQRNKRCNWCPANMTGPASVFDSCCTLCAKQMTSWLFPGSDRSCPYCIDGPKEADGTSAALLDFIFRGLLHLDM